MDADKWTCASCGFTHNNRFVPTCAECDAARPGDVPAASPRPSEAHASHIVPLDDSPGASPTPEAAGLRADMSAHSSSSQRGQDADSECVSDSEGEEAGGAADQAPVRTEPGGDECAGGAAGGGGVAGGAERKAKERQEATAIVLGTEDEAMSSPQVAAQDAGVAGVAGVAGGDVPAYTQAAQAQIVWKETSVQVGNAVLTVSKET